MNILRRTHLSALSLKQSLIQELEDIIKEKDEYIAELEDKMMGKQARMMGLKVVINT